MQISQFERGRWGGLGAWAWAFAFFGLFLAWDAAGLDLPLARLMGGPEGFAWRDHWLLNQVLHTGARQLAALLVLWLLAGLWWPRGVLRRLSRAGRIQWLASTLVSLAVISALKHSSPSSCPWDLAEFGGAAHHLSHWAFWRSDGGPGHCFPAGHASAAFAFIGGYLVLREVSPTAAARILALVILAGALLGASQQLRGAHFMSHTLWTAWLCWAVACAVNTAAGLFRQPCLELRAA